MCRESNGSADTLAHDSAVRGQNRESAACASWMEQRGSHESSRSEGRRKVESAYRSETPVGGCGVGHGRPETILVTGS